MDFEVKTALLLMLVSYAGKERSLLEQDQGSTMDDQKLQLFYVPQSDFRH